MHTHPAWRPYFMVTSLKFLRWERVECISSSSKPHLVISIHVRNWWFVSEWKQFTFFLGVTMTRWSCYPLTYWCWVTHICVNKLTIIGSDNGLSPDRHQAIIWTNTGILLLWPLGTNFREILIEVLTVSFKKVRLEGSSLKWSRHQCANCDRWFPLTKGQ